MRKWIKKLLPVRIGLVVGLLLLFLFGVPSLGEKLPIEPPVSGAPVSSP